MYLLEESAEAVEMRQRVANMLESAEEVQVLLGLQLLKGGGVHHTHLTHLLALTVWQARNGENTPKIKMQAKKLFHDWATPDMKNWQKIEPLHTIHNLDKYMCKRDPAFTKYLLEYTPKAKLDKDVLATMALLTIGTGAKYLLEHKIQPVAWIIAKMLEKGYADTLNFQNFGLTTLPAEVGDFADIKYLNLLGNPLQNIPHNLINLKKLQEIKFDHHTFSKQAVGKLMLFFPDIIAQHFYAKACEVKRKVKKRTFPIPNPDKAYLEAIPLFEKACEAKPDYAEVWHNIGACWIFYGKPEKATEALHKALDCYQERIDCPVTRFASHTTNEHNLFWKSCVYALLKEKQKGMDLLQLLVDIRPIVNNYLHTTLEEEDWAMYREDEDLQALCK